MSLQSLVFCSDEKIVRVLRRVLSDLEIAVDHCVTADTVIRRLTRQRFEAVIVDCADEEQAAQILKSVRSAPCNKHAVSVALVDGQTALRSAFEMGAHFVLYKPISSERAKASFRAARALMKRERRRNERIPNEFPVMLLGHGKQDAQRTNSVDLSEGGIAVQLPAHLNRSGQVQVKFTLPETEFAVNCVGEIAWENAAHQAGVRFRNLDEETREQIKKWVRSHSADPEKDDAPVQCKLTDLSLGGCYLETATPFPLNTRVKLSMRVGEFQIDAEGIIRVVHAELGMGVEFRQRTPQQRESVDKFIQALMNSNGVLPDLLVEPEGIESDPGEPGANSNQEQMEDPLIELFHKKAQLSTEAFLAELRRQRRSTPDHTQAASL